MLSENDLKKWCDLLGYSHQTQNEIEIIRNSQPSRRVGSSKRSVCGRYPSQKMGVTIQFESHKVELPFIHQLEHDDNVLEYYDQPPPFKLSYESKTGRSIGYYYTADFFVIKKDSAGWWECKPEAKLQELAEKKPEQYFLGDDNEWHFIPAEAYASKLGLNFRVWSSASIDWILQQNLEFLADYFRYDYCDPKQSAADEIISLVVHNVGITLSELFETASEVQTDVIYKLIAKEQIYFDLSSSRLVEPEKCHLFRDRASAESYIALSSSQNNCNTITISALDLSPGTPIDYDGTCLTLTLIGQDKVLLQTQNDEPVEFTKDVFENLIRQGKIISLRSKDTVGVSDKAREFLQQASQKDLEKANQRYRSIQPYLDGQPIKRGTFQERSLRNWLFSYRKAEQEFGYGYMGLLNFDYQKGNRTRRLPQYVLDLMEDCIKNHYEAKKQPTKKSTYAIFVNSCVEAGMDYDQIPSDKTFYQEIKKRSGYKQTLTRQGSRAAYDLESMYWELELTTPRHGNFPFHICHIDHTQSDIELRCSKTGKNLGRPWITFLVDAFSRRVLAVYITYDPPSYRSCMMVLRICVKRHGRLPQTVVTDNGKEFHSTYFETLLAMFECTLKHRPAAKSRFSGVCERLFGTTTTQLLNNLAGNTQITKKVRLATKSVNPKNLSLWTIGLLYAHLGIWINDVYEQTEHPSLEGFSPKEAFADGIKRFGSRDLRRISYDDNFKFLTLPSSKRGKAKVHHKGVIIEYKHYWHDALRNPEIQGSLVDVRYDPFDAGKAYVYIRGQWLECISEYYPLFQGRSEKEIQLAVEELKRRKKNYSKNYKIRARTLGNFLAEIQSEEELLKQKLKDEQGKEILRVIEGGLPNLTPFNSSEVLLSADTEARVKPNTLSVVEPSRDSKRSNNKRRRFKSY